MVAGSTLQSNVPDRATFNLQPSTFNYPERPATWIAGRSRRCHALVLPAGPFRRAARRGVLNLTLSLSH